MVSEPRDLVAIWNGRVPIGTPVHYWPVMPGEPIVTRTRTQAWRLCNGVAVVSVEGIAGGVALDHVSSVVVAGEAMPTDASSQDQGSAEPVLRTREVAAGATTTVSPPADPTSHHWLTFAIEQCRLFARITCTAPVDSLCRLDCAVRGCEQEEQPPHTAHDGMSVHRAIDSGRCHVVEAFENAGGLYPDKDGSDVARCYEGIPGPLGTVPVDAWLDETGPGWDLLHRHATETDADWTAKDEAGHRAQQPRDRRNSPPFTPFPVSQFRAGLEQTHRALDSAAAEDGAS